MTITALSAMVFLPFVLPICLWVAWSDMATMRIPNKAVMALFFVYAIIGIFVLPLDEYLWRYLHLVIILFLGIILNAAGAIGAGDAKFAAAAAPLVALGDLRLLMVLFAANLLAAVITHRLAKKSPLRRMAPNWESWNRGWDFPMGLSLGTTLAIYLILGALYGA
ncbi:prepilin peptidase [Alisedimentitalea sp. MJ-SS2]|uniref:prepilin peptidase n=1 Tax=Aliisedimentitalea sp. MJ-SS2 TaxID=3049795 RepID=UPI00291346DF|nr:prepilin peptidase [Alisedimentitalea sp. MJ-SS2]MDU8926084.1 prepilin peptidase [Alisedimentitalea sp. MJ-SS2]